MAETRPPGDDLIAPGGKVDQQTLYDLYEKAGEDDQAVCVRFRVNRPSINKRLDRYLVDRIPFLSRTSLQQLIREQAVTVNGRVPKPSTKVSSGDVIEAILPPPPSTELPAQEMPLEVLHEDEHLIVINKAPDVIVHPARGNQSGTIINGLAWHFQHRSGGELSPVGEELARPGVVHRLDRNTTGVLVFAKSEVAHWRLARQFEQRRVEKRYLTVVHGEIEPWADVIDVPLGKHPTVREKYAVRWDPTGKPSVTLYHLRERYEGFSLLEIALKTGRTHQIRVHLSHLGYPVVGDDMYGGKHLTVGDAIGTRNRQVLIHRQMLHAALLAFTHPITKRPLTFTAPLPEDMGTLVRLLREHRFKEAPELAGVLLDINDLLG
jgi:23S rRNA pseudouridine1911/1915/1917 synthase